MNRLLPALALASLVVAVGASQAATGRLVIRHQLHGCHTWSYNGNTYSASQRIHLARGASLTIVDADVMPHTLVQQSGPHAVFGGPATMHMMNATLRVTFPKPGVYTFVTKAGEDYMPGMKTIGKDNVLRLTVTVA